MNDSNPTQILRPPAIFACVLLFCATFDCDLQAQENPANTPVASTANLSQRLTAAMDARNSGDPAAIGRASERVLALALAEMARLRLDEKAYEQSMRLSEESLRFEDAAETRVELALASLYANKPAEAAKQASAATELDPQNYFAWAIKGEVLLESRDYTGASETFAKSLALKRDPESLYAFGLSQLGMGAKQKAAETFAKFLTQVGDSGGSRVLVGRAYQGQGMWSEAKTEFNNALVLDPTTLNANYFWAITILQANEANATPEVYSHLHAELRLNPRHFEANYMLGSLASMARNDDASDRYLHLASEIKPSVPETWVLLGLNAQRRKSNQAAMEYFRKAIERGKNLDSREHLELRKAYLGLGRLLISSGKTKEGEEMLSQARELQAKNLAADQKSFAALNAPREVAPMGSEAPYIPSSDSGRQLSLSSNSVATPAKIGGALEARSAAHSRSDPQGKFEKYLQTVLGASFNDLATAEALESNYVDALGHYREAAQWDPKIPGLQRNLGLAAYFAGQPAEAIRLLSNTMVQAPGDSHARAVLGLAYFSFGNFAKTVQTITPIAEQALQDPELGLAWATSLNQTGNKRAAIQALEHLQASGKLLSAIEQFERTAQSQPANLSYHLGLEEAYRKVGRVADADQQHAICESLRGTQKSPNNE